ncbi:hypothetical protein HW423_05700, partial [Aerococcaceae bacterium INB8]|nr:hypothetical protein [Ruoffia halotolerans]
MAIDNFIANFLEIKDPNIEFHEAFQTIKENGVTTKILSGTLSYPLED